MSEIIFRRTGNIVSLGVAGAQEANELAPGTYTLCGGGAMGPMHLHITEDLGAPGKLYGDIDKRAKHVLKTFLSREGVVTGVLLSGSQGTGKTLLGKRIVELARVQHKIPTILINDAYGGTEFSRFMSDIKQPTVVLVDEFEKVYHEPEMQQRLLTLLDGAYSSHKLFIFIVNETENIIETLSNRPGRIMYHWRYHRLEREVVKQYARESLKDQSQLGGVLIAMEIARVSSFDIMKALIWEMNQYNLRAGEAVVNLNMDLTGYVRAKTQVCLKKENNLTVNTSVDWSPIDKSLDFTVHRYKNLSKENEAEDHAGGDATVSFRAGETELARQTTEGYAMGLRNLHKSNVFGAHANVNSTFGKSGAIGSFFVRAHVPGKSDHGVNPSGTFAPLYTPLAAPYAGPGMPFGGSYPGGARTPEEVQQMQEVLLEQSRKFEESKVMVRATAADIITEDLVEGVIEYDTEDFFIRVELVSDNTTRSGKATEALPF